MNCIKKIGFALLALMMMASTLSCGSDDSGASSKQTLLYKISLGQGVTLNNVNFRDADGNFVSVLNPGGSTWTKSIEVERPFEGTLDFNITNTSDTPKTFEYTISIGSESGTGGGFINPGVTASQGGGFDFD